MCEFEELVEQIRAKYNLAEPESITHFVDNLAAEVNNYKRRDHSFETVINDIRAILGLQPGESIIEAVMALKREPKNNLKDRFETGDLVLGRGFHTGGEWVERVFLYFRRDGVPVCEAKSFWDNNRQNPVAFDEIKPVVPRYEERILDPVRMMRWLVLNGWKVSGDGLWMSPSIQQPNFNQKMWQFCGGNKPTKWTWHPEWIEKVEIK